MANNNKSVDPCKVVTGLCRMCYAHIWEATAINDGEPKFSACILVPKNDKPTLEKIQAAVEAAIQDGIRSKWQGRRPGKLKLPLRDGDEERPDDAVFQGCYYINANATRQPGVVDMARAPILDRDEVYSGCYCRFSINFYPFNSHGNTGVGVRLNHVQKVSDGMLLSGGSSAEDDFDDDFASDLADIM